jgi:hypothetical protein
MSSATKELVDDDGFKLVVRRKKSSNNTRQPKQENKSMVKDRDFEKSCASSFSVDSFLSRQVALQRKIQQTPLFSSLRNETPTFHSVICYGLGSLSISRSKLQLALLCSLLDDLSPCTNKVSFDPCHGESDKLVLKSLGFTIIEVDERGQRDLNPNETTLFFMPHCDRWLYCNVLEKHKDHLSSIVILGNSFKEYSKISTDVDAVATAALTNVEKKFSLLPGDESHLDEGLLFEAFNDFRLMTFRS